MHFNDVNGRGNELQAILSRTAEFVEHWRDLADCHTAEFISASLWDKVVPEELRLELDAAHPDHVLAVFCEQAPHHYDKQKSDSEHYQMSPQNEATCRCLGQFSSKQGTETSNNANHCSGACRNAISLPNFKHFLMEARKACNAFSTLTTNPEELFKLLEVLPAGEDNAELFPGSCCLDATEVPLPLMSDKKQHEVRAMAEVVARLADSLGAETAVVDLGAGKGYLGAAVARVGRPVLGLEVDDGNVKAAAHRVAKLHKGRSKTTELHSDKEKSNPTASDWLRTATVSVDVGTDISQLVSAHFGLPAAQLTLAGLHTCGDLAAASLRIFLRTPSARAACLVGCCYHLLSGPDGSPARDCRAGAGFPLSRRLCGFVLGRNARMLAQQSLERSLADMQQVLISVRGLHWRALLETLLPAVGTSSAHRVGKLAARCASFSEYAHRAFEKLGIDEQAGTDELSALATQHEPNLHRLRALALLRLALAPVLERLVLLDRAQLLHEQGISRWFLVQLFTPLVSPRCFALVALKEKDGLHC